MRKVALALALLLCAYSGAATFATNEVPLESVVRVISTYPDGKKGICTGWVLDDVKNKIVTAAHCTRGATGVVIQLTTGDYFTGHPVGESLELDVALLLVHEIVELKAVRVADSDKVEIGDKVVAIGNPLGAWFVVTYGQIFEKYGPSQFHTARINFGNSGGPLFDAQGRVVGMNVAMWLFMQRVWLHTISIPSNDVLAAVRLIESKNP
jgi:S1-C subfamily serine protease